MLESHPGIHQAAVVPVPDELKGHKSIAFIVRAILLCAEHVRQLGAHQRPVRRHTARLGHAQEFAVLCSTRHKRFAPRKSYANLILQQNHGDGANYV